MSSEGEQVLVIPSSPAPIDYEECPEGEEALSLALQELDSEPIITNVQRRPRRDGLLWQVEVTHGNERLPFISATTSEYRDKMRFHIPKAPAHHHSTVSSPLSALTAQTPVWRSQAPKFFTKLPTSRFPASWRSQESLSLSMDVSMDVGSPRHAVQALDTSRGSWKRSSMAPYCLSPPKQPAPASPYKRWSHRTARMEMFPRERPMPHTLGEDVPTVAVTPDLKVGRWPPVMTSTEWRKHCHGMQPNVLPSPWYTHVTNALTPRGGPAPGGGPNQHPKEVRTVLAPKTIVRPQRPFTHASAELADDLMMEAREFIWMHDAVKAVSRLEHALTLEPNHAEVMGMLGKIRQEEFQEYGKAEELYKKALLLQPNNALALAGLASVMENVREDYETADQLYTKALEINPDDANLLTNYALFVRKVYKDLPRSRAYVLEALKRSPNHPWLKEHAHKF